ncbi:biotin/lipoyl-binding carrier protein [Nocardioides rubriscoriae]|uniref:biotin/lipoyl-binding carrier protein n=1 Tax=Nocardioides rubriscoriae TaxID=642762 RepID=UPI0011DF9BCE|nr:biotin/lipoyl-binding carrier protein [Nocardioides rubriscoriae]
MVREQRSDIVAEMVANVLEVVVAAGDAVAVGDEVALLESMKMEIPVVAETAGTVTAVKVAPGDVVQEGDVLLSLSV